MIKAIEIRGRLFQLRIATCGPSSYHVVLTIRYHNQAEIVTLIIFILQIIFHKHDSSQYSLVVKMGVATACVMDLAIDDSRNNNFSSAWQHRDQDGWKAVS